MGNIANQARDSVAVVAYNVGLCVTELDRYLDVLKQKNLDWINTTKDNIGRRRLRGFRIIVQII